MDDTSTTNSVTFQVLYRIPFRYLYIPGLYILLLGFFTFGHALHTVFTHQDPGGYYKFLIWLVLVFGFWVSQAGAHLCVIWLTFRDLQFPDVRGKHIVMTDSAKRTNKVLRGIAKLIPWRYAYIPGLFLVVFDIFILTHSLRLHWAHFGPADWDTMLHVHFRTVQGVCLELAGFIVCMGSYVFKGVELEDAEEMEQKGQDISNGDAFERKVRVSSEHDDAR
ncbi:uncharacterized protein J4E84_009647 [Alternaria hordeiaustralica]|uniref:uncharacterized protein n=1 Tax=Alternaria hordeiaustralica TaxID=1187925 RepID=UPI0020C3F84A|nr:uncharacterized protein J4E84_009647 [Alternaria hordeiaustralica]KAI4676031.1 hypothetical protein J4E84_009647 [Alternaria hordeiaustralica]